jgi:hypothetical protein
MWSFEALINCEFQEFLSFRQQSVSQRELIFSRLFNDLRLFDGKSIRMNFPFRAAICQHIVSKIGVGKSTQCGAPGSAPFENAINSGISRLRFFNHSCPFHLIMSLTRLNEGIGRHLMKLTVAPPRTSIAEGLDRDY